MNLRNQPISERAFSTFVILALATFLAGGLAFTLRQDRGRQSAPATQPHLLAALEGIMAPNVSAAETDTFRVWIQSGARREDFGPVGAIVANNCARCHGQDGQYPRIASFKDVHSLALDNDSLGLYALIGARALHLALFPLVFLVAIVGYLRRTTGAHRWTLVGGCGVAVLFDMGQWWLRQGRPESLWAAWMAAAALTVAMSALLIAVLSSLWGPEAP